MLPGIVPIELITAITSILVRTELEEKPCITFPEEGKKKKNSYQSF